MRIVLLIVFVLFCSIIIFPQVIYPYRTCPSPKELVEFSGIAKIDKNTLVGVNDGGNAPCLFFMDTLGRLTKKKCISTIKNIDWEEICYKSGIIYICDIGDNLSRRKESIIYQYDIYKDSIIGWKNLSFQEKPGTILPKPIRHYDFEASFFFDGKLWFFSKTHSNPYKGISYQYIDNPLRLNAILKASDSTVFGTQGFIQNSITGAAISPRKYLSAFISCTHVWFKFNFFNEPSFFKQINIDFDFDGLTQKEAITFTSDYKFVVADERTAKMMGGRLYFFDLKPYIDGRKKYTKPMVNSSSLKKNPKDNTCLLKLKLTKKPTNLNILLFDKAGKCIFKSEIKANSTDISKKIIFKESDKNEFKYANSYWIINDLNVIYGDKIY